MLRLTLAAVTAAVAVIAFTPAPVISVTYDKQAFLTFSGPVQIPGATLNAGTYQFRLTNPDTSRNVLQVLNNDGSIVYAMFHTISDRRAVVTDDPVVSFRETPAGVPPAVRSLFYGGEHRGYKFVYPKGGPIMLPPVWRQPEITYAPLPVVKAPEAPAAISEPEPEIVVDTEPMPEPEPEPVPPAAAPVPELPRTASLLPVVATGGLASLLIGLGVGLLRRRLN